MGRKLIWSSFATAALLLAGCSGAGSEDAKDAFLDAPSKPPVSEAKAQQDRGISPEVAQGMAEPGLGGKR
ncbi:MAG: hypothetical protein CBB60_004340 [Armatimonadetes bacterium Cent15-Ar3]|nr:MAG: hypothetical protein CBB60_004340 [Armatimonadetes bacterium Cent15-Ar3]